MRLEDLYKNFGTSTPEEQEEFIVAYRLRRAKDLAQPPSESKRSGAIPSLELTTIEKQLIKNLGLKQKDLLALRDTILTDRDTGVKLFQDEIFEEVED